MRSAAPAPTECPPKTKSGKRRASPSTTRCERTSATWQSVARVRRAKVASADPTKRRYGRRQVTDEEAHDVSHHQAVTLDRARRCRRVVPRSPTGRATAGCGRHEGSTVEGRALLARTGARAVRNGAGDRLQQRRRPDARATLGVVESGLLGAKRLHRVMAGHR